MLSAAGIDDSMVLLGEDVGGFEEEEPGVQEGVEAVEAVEEG